MWYDSDDRRWEKAQSRYSRRGLALFVGAGMSVGLGPPSWTQLMERLAAKLHPEGASIIHKLRSVGFSLPSVASLLAEKSKSSGLDFAECVRQEVYRGFEIQSRKAPQEQFQAFADRVCRDKPSLAATAALCVRPIAAGGFEANPKVHAVVNMNFDDLFTTFLRARYGSYILRITERAAHSADPLGLISCYHPHGRLSFEPHAGHRRETPDQLVLTEQSFYEFFNQPNSVFHYTLLYLLREYHNLFIGMSFQDENVRRLLHYSAAERRSDYRKEFGPGLNPQTQATIEERARWKALRHFAVFNRREFDGVAADWEASLVPLGVAVLWVDNWEDDFARRMAALYGPGWNQVYA